MTVEELLAKQEIYELACTYMRGLDRLDPQLLHSVFHADAFVDYGIYEGSASRFVDFAMNALRDHHANHHMLGQVHISALAPGGETAYGEVYFQAFHRVADAEGEKDLFISGRYLDRYERRGSIWKIAFRSEVNDWARTSPAADQHFEQAPEGLRGARKPDDRSYDRAFLNRRE